MKFVWQALASKLDGTTHFLDNPVIDNYQEKLENEELPDGVIVLENMNFRREEWGFEKPEEPDEPSVIEEEVEEEEEEPDFKSMSAKEKKEWEAKQKEKEEAKKKAEEEKAALEGEGEGEEEEKEEELEVVIPDVTHSEIDNFKALMS
jgi:Mg-chelatase subunit ChlI